jgi:hypothetical protein
VPTFIFYIDIPVTILNEYGYIIVTEIPPDIVVIFPVLGRFYRQCEIPAAQAPALVT